MRRLTTNGTKRQIENASQFIIKDNGGHIQTERTYQDYPTKYLGVVVRQSVRGGASESEMIEPCPNLTKGIDLHLFDRHRTECV